jgi:hypothetical protein
MAVLAALAAAALVEPEPFEWLLGVTSRDEALLARRKAAAASRAWPVRACASATAAWAIPAKVGLVIASEKRDNSAYSDQ